MPQLDIYILNGMVNNSISLYLLLLLYNMFNIILILNILLKMSRLIYFLVKNVLILLNLQKKYLKNNYYIIKLFFIVNKNLNYIKNEILFNEFVIDKYKNIMNILKQNIKKKNKKKNIITIDYKLYL